MNNEAFGIPEVYGYDAFGMRIAKDAANGLMGATPAPPMGMDKRSGEHEHATDEHATDERAKDERAKDEHGDHHPTMVSRCFGSSPVMYDRDINNRIIAERRTVVDDEQFLSTYTYGVLGLISRTDEKRNYDTSDNEDYLYLADAMGNHVGLIDADGTTHIQEFDAFGVSLDALILSDDPDQYYQVLPGQHMWRGGEGSETDVLAENCWAQHLSNRLVHMGFRYYEPETGRFTQRDPIGLIGNPTTFIPYLYGENDPVNRTDPSGLIAPLFFMVAFAGGFVAGLLAADLQGALQLILAGMLGALLGVCFDSTGAVTMSWLVDLMLASMGTLAGLVLGVVPLLILSFSLGMLAGILVGSLLSMNEEPAGNTPWEKSKGESVMHATRRHVLRWSPVCELGQHWSSA